MSAVPAWMCSRFTFEPAVSTGTNSIAGSWARSPLRMASLSGRKLAPGRPVAMRTARRVAAARAGASPHAAAAMAHRHDVISAPTARCRDFGTHRGKLRIIGPENDEICATRRRGCQLQANFDYVVSAFRRSCGPAKAGHYEKWGRSHDKLRHAPFDLTAILRPRIDAIPEGPRQPLRPGGDRDRARRAPRLRCARIRRRDAPARRRLH